MPGRAEFFALPLLLLSSLCGGSHLLDGRQRAPPKLDWRLATHLFKDSREMLDGNEPAVESDVTDGKGRNTRAELLRCALALWSETYESNYPLRG